MPYLIQALKDSNNPTWDSRPAAARALGRFKEFQPESDEIIITLKEALKDRDSNLRQAAAEALGEIRDKRSVPELIIAMKEDEKGYVRQAAVKSLGLIGDAQAVPDLICEIKGFGTYSREASESLGRIGRPALNDLIEVLREGNEFSRLFARHAIVIVLGKSFTDEIIENPAKALNNENSNQRFLATEVLRDRIKHSESKSKDINIALNGALKDDYWCVRRAAAEALGQMGDVQAVPDLITALKNDERSLVRVAAAESLGQIKDDHSVPDLILALNDKHQGVRMMAARSLGQIGNAAAVQSLIITLSEDEEMFARSHAAFSLGEIGDVEAVPHLIRTLNDKNEDEYVRRAAASALGSMGDDNAFYDLIRALEDDVSKDVRMQAAESLGKIRNTEAVPYLIRAMKEDDISFDAQIALSQIGRPALPDLIIALNNDDWHIRRGAAIVLGEIQDAKAIPNLIGVLKDDEWLVRRYALEALIKIGSPAFQHLFRALKDSDERVRSGAAESLDRIKGPELTDLIQSLEDESRDVRRVAAKIISRIEDSNAVPYLIQALKDRDDYVRGAAASGLGLNGDINTVPILIQAAKDRDGYVRSEAAEALGLLASKMKKLSDVQSVSRALRWRLTDHIFVPSWSTSAFCALNLAADRLAVLEVEALQANDPLSCPQSTDDSTLAKYAKDTLKPKPIAYSVLTFILALSIGILVDKIPTDAQELIALWAAHGQIIFIVIIFILIIGALVFVLLDHKSEELKKRA